MNNRDKKVAEVGRLAESMEKAKSVVLVDFVGMGVKLQQELKKLLKEAGASIVVTKNTLLKLAAEKAKEPKELYEGDILIGQTALVVGMDDAVSPIQILGKFVKEHELPKFKAGVVDGTFSDSAGLMKISTLPTKEVLLGQVVGGVAAPMYGLLGVMNANMQKLIYVLKQASTKGGDN